MDRGRCAEDVGDLWLLHGTETAELDHLHRRENNKMGGGIRESVTLPCGSMLDVKVKSESFRALSESFALKKKNAAEWMKKKFRKFRKYSGK